MQPRKVRIVADEIRGKSAGHAAALLRFHSAKGARELRKVLMSAIANAVENNHLAEDSLRIATIMVDEGPRLKRIQAKAMGRAGRIIKKSSHITVVVEDVERTESVKPHGTKAKPRPTFATPKQRKERKQPLAAAEVAPIGEDAAPVEAAPEEATPVSESDAPEEQGSAAPEPESAEATPESEEESKGAE